MSLILAARSRICGTVIMPKRRRFVGRVLACGGLLLLGSAVSLYLLIRQSLPKLDGAVMVTGISSPVTVERDALGIPTITGKTRQDVAFATGFVHAQDRLFQMDLLRRNSAGELAELFGPVRLSLDRQRRVHRFRHMAELVYDGLDKSDQDLLLAYTAGVNAVIEQATPPPEYLVLRSRPRRWQPADCMLVVYSMALALQDPRDRLDRMEDAMQKSLPEALIRFLTKQEGDWDGALWTEAPKTWPLPPAEVFDLRQQRDQPHTATGIYTAPPADSVRGGSNCWAVTGDRTAAGKGALLANDMHLPLAVPNIWYRARFVWESSPKVNCSITGATLPGAFPMIIGSNGSIAWGYTNACVDTMDLVKTRNFNRSSSPHSPGPGQSYTTSVETIYVKGGPPEVIETMSTDWGPIIGQDNQDNLLALQWPPHFRNATNWNWLKMETATTVAEAIEIAHRTGPLTLNMIVADRSGSIGWTLAGPLPVRDLPTTQMPLSEPDLRAKWPGWLSPERYPRVATAKSGFLWSANNRAVGGHRAEEIGDGGYDEGARACQIRDTLQSLSKATEADMLALQLDDRAVFLEPWRELFLQVLTALPDDEKTRAVRILVKEWDGHARPDQAGYFLVGKFRECVARRTFIPLFSPCVAIYPEFDYRLFRSEHALWKLLQDQPAHLLDSQYPDWSSLQAAAAADVFKFFDASIGRTLAPTVAIRHPLSRGWPVVRDLLDMPLATLPGGHNGVPRIQRSSFGASERMVVEPGREEYGYFQMPCGQSGHPLSPHYRDGQKAWAEGTRQPFLPGPTEHLLTLRPK